MNTDRNAARNINAVGEFTIEQALQLGYIKKVAPIGYFSTVDPSLKVNANAKVRVRMNTGAIVIGE